MLFAIESLEADDWFALAILVTYIDCDSLCLASHDEEVVVVVPYRKDKITGLAYASFAVATKPSVTSCAVRLKSNADD